MDSNTNLMKMEQCIQESMIMENIKYTMEKMEKKVPVLKNIKRTPISSVE